MRLIDIKCPNCGADLRIDSENKECTCQYCGAKFLIDDEVLHVRYDNAEESGYQFEKGRQRAMREAQQAYYQPRYNQQTPPRRRHILLWIFGWLFIFPIPLTILVVRSQKLKPLAKAVIIAAGWILYIAMCAGDSSEGQQTSSADVTTEVSEVSEITTLPESAADVIDEYLCVNNDAASEYAEGFITADENSGKAMTEWLALPEYH